MSNFYYYCFECNYATRTKEKDFIKAILYNFNKNQVTNIGITVNNNPYCLQFLIFVYIESEENKTLFENWLKNNYPDKHKKFNIFTTEMSNLCNFLYPEHVDLLITEKSGGLFFFDEKEIFEKEKPQYKAIRPTPPKIFLSHSSKNKTDIVEPIYHYLQTQQISIWLDKYEIDYGDNIYQEISKGIDNAEMAIFVITEDFLDSKWCKEEQSSLFELTCNDKAIVINAMKDNSKLPRMLQSRKYLEWNELNPDRTMKELAAVIKRKV